MTLYLVVFGVAVATFASLFFSSITYALRDFSRPRLQQRMQEFGREKDFESTAEHAPDLIFVTAIGRLFANIFTLICVLRLFHETRYPLHIQYLLAVVVTGIITLFASVAIPSAAAKYAGATLIAVCAPFLHFLRLIMSPVTKVMHFTDDLMRRAAGAQESPEPAHIEQDILSAVEEGEKEGVVDEEEREIIESVIDSRDTTVGQIMTARTEMIAIELPTNLQTIKKVLQDSGLSRVPLFEGTLDHIVGVLYARDLLQFVGVSADRFDIRAAMRIPLFVPESKPLRDLFNDFRLQKVHIAIVLDEYGGTAGLVTIEDILEELVGDISDEHEAHEPAALRKIDENSWDADARVYVDELNRTIGLSLPEDDGYDTLGGFISTTLGRIPPNGTTFENAGVKYTIIDAEPQKVNRVRIDLVLQPTAATAPETTPKQA